MDAGGGGGSHEEPPDLAICGEQRLPPLQGMGAGQSGHQLQLMQAMILNDDALAIEDVLSFWFEDPVQHPEQLLAKFQRWYLGGAALDAEIGERFGALIAAALDGQLQHWCATPRGRLALIVLLDQFTRNIHRGTPRAYAGDRAALALALQALADDGFHAHSLEEQLFVIMPLVHAEELPLQVRAVELVRQLLERAPPALREPWQRGYLRAQHYRSVIARFGRFPQRNAILGRPSSSEEQAFLDEEALRPGPLAPASPANSAES